MKKLLVSTVVLTTVLLSVFTINFYYPLLQFEAKTADAEAPTLTVNTVYPAVESIDVSVRMSQSGKFGCVALTAGSPSPSENDVSDFKKVTSNENGYVELRNLDSEVSYDIYCYGISDFGIPMSTTIAETKQTTTTKGRNDAPVVIIGRVDSTDTEATITALSTLPGKLYCIVTAPAYIPSRLEIKEKSTAVPIGVYTYTTHTTGDLTASTEYRAFCNVETNTGVPMLSIVDDVGQLFESAEAPESVVMFILRIAATVFCICMSGIFSGLNLGLMGLDLISLQMISETDVDEIAGKNADPEEVKQIKLDKERATKILPIRRKGNLLLCTLLIGNVMVNSVISILTADMTTGTIGFLISTCLITTFGEVIPQAYCSRYGLKIGALSTGLMKVIIGVLYIICKPVSAILDYCLGDEMGNIYNRYQLYTMFELYKEHSDFKKDTIKTMQGALVMDTKTVIEYMQPLDKVFMLPDTAILDHNTCLEIFRKGFSRIPVYHESRQNIRGILHSKELILLNPNQCVSVEAILNLFPSSVLVIDGTRTVSDSMKDMVNSHTELAFVSNVVESSDKDKSLEIAGIVTLEDLIKAVMRLDLVDETPMIEDTDHSEKVANIFSQVMLSHLDNTTLDIITYFINQSLAKQDLYLPSDVIHNLIQKGTIEKVSVGDQPIYEVNKYADFAVVIMQGVFTVYIGEDRMVTEKPVFSVINISSLLEDNFVSSVSLQLHERPIVDVLTNEVTGFNKEGFIIKIPKSVANELNIKSRIVPLRKNSTKIANGESEHSVMLPLEIEEGPKPADNSV